MKKPNLPPSLEHPDDLLLPYIEDTIAPEEKARLNEHLRQCGECALKLKELRETTAALKQNKQAFCPEPWELYEFAMTGADPNGTVSIHVQDCPLCSQELNDWKSTAREEAMPPELWDLLRKHLPEAGPGQISSRPSRWDHVFLQNLARFSKAPAMAAGVALAALLFVVIFYSQDMMHTRIGLSSVKWEGVPRAKSLQKSAVFIIFFKDFKKSISQKDIDSLYEALRPSVELSEHYNIISPADISDAVKDGEISPYNGTALIKGLRNKLNVSYVLVVTVYPANGKLSALLQLDDSTDRRVLATGSVENVNWGDLAARIRSDAFGLLLSSGDKR